jgi:hypothetical protein
MKRWVTTLALVACLLATAWALAGCRGRAAPTTAIQPAQPADASAAQPTGPPTSASPTEALATQPPAPTAEPTAEPTVAQPAPTKVPPTETPLPTATQEPAAGPDPARGQQLWAQKPCLGCYGSNAEGQIGPRLAGTSRSVDQVLRKVRNDGRSMPAFPPSVISDQELADIVAWLQSLAG